MLFLLAILCFVFFLNRQDSSFGPSVAPMLDSLNALNHLNFPRLLACLEQASRLPDIFIFELATVHHRCSVSGSCSLPSPAGAVQIRQVTW